MLSGGQHHRFTLNHEPVRDLSVPRLSLLQVGLQRQEDTHFFLRCSLQLGVLLLLLCVLCAPDTHVDQKLHPLGLYTSTLQNCCTLCL